MAGRLSGVESRNVTYLSDTFPVFWEEARGANVRDADGNVLLDLTSAFGVAIAGHAHPAVADAIHSQTKRMIHGMGDVHPPSVKVELMERLAALAPWPEPRTVLASSGSEAVEIALKTALLKTGRRGVVTFEGGYHGLTLGALGVTPRDHFQAPFRKWLPPAVGVASWPEPLRQGPAGIDRCLRQVEAFLRKGVPVGGGDPDADGGERVPVGAVILEPVQGRGGVRIPPEIFVQAVAHLAEMHGALLIADEVYTGMGRCGRNFGSQRMGFEPHIVCLGKALAGGMPLSACMAPRHVMDAWPDSTGEAVHTSTFLGHPVSCAAAIAMVDLVLGGLPEEVEAVGSKLFGMLRDILDGLGGVGEVRGVGGMIGVELVDRDGEPRDGAAAAVAEAALRRGVIVLPAGDRGNVVQCAPPSVLTSEQILFAVDALHEAVREALRSERL